MTIIYSVERHDYSDNTTYGLFSTREKAQALVDWLREDNDYHNDLEIFERIVDEVADIQGKQCWSVESAEGSIEVVEAHPVGHVLWDEKPYRSLKTLQPQYRNRLRCHVLATDEAHARKIAADRFRQFVAEESLLAETKEKP